jgi:hypothetical protein
MLYLINILHNVYSYIVKLFLTFFCGGKIRQINIAVDVSRTPSQLLNIFRFPSGNERELARAGEIYHRYAREMYHSPQVHGRFTTDTRQIYHRTREMYHRYTGDLTQVRMGFTSARTRQIYCTTGTQEM